MQLIFEWDANKARSNLNKHKVSFKEAKTYFNDPFLITFPDDYHSEYYDERFISIGRSAGGRILLVVHTEQRENNNLTVRLISCRKATPSERRTYEEDK